MEYRVVDYQGADGSWYNVDSGDPEPTRDDIEASDRLNLGFTDEDDNWHYRWVDGPFTVDDYWLDDVILEISDEYGIAIAAV